jgi:hypothetical protein
MNVYHVLGSVRPGAEHPSLRAAAAAASNGHDRSLTIGLDALPPSLRAPASEGVRRAAAAGSDRLAPLLSGST